MDERTDEEPEEIETPDYLPPEEVAENFRVYLDALDDETHMAEEMVAALEDGRLTSEDMLDAMPDPSPMEAWDRDEYRELRDDGHDFTPNLDTEADDGGE